MKSMLQKMLLMQNELKQWNNKYKTLEDLYVKLQIDKKEVEITLNKFEQTLKDVRNLLKPIYERRNNKMYNLADELQDVRNIT